MEKLELTLLLDKDYDLLRYYLYRSREEENGRPIVDGVYIQRDTVGENPPEKMKLLLEWA